MTCYLALLACLFWASPPRGTHFRSGTRWVQVVPPGDARAASRLAAGRWVKAHGHLEILLQGACLVDLGPGSELRVTPGPGCGRIQLRKGPARILVGPRGRLELNGRRLAGPGILSLDSRVRPCRAGRACGSGGKFDLPPVPAVKVAWKLGRLRSLRAEARQTVQAASGQGVTSAAGGSMCLDTSSGSSAAGVEHQGSNPIQKPSARTLVRVRVTFGR